MVQLFSSTLGPGRYPELLLCYLFNGFVTLGYSCHPFLCSVFNLMFLSLDMNGKRDRYFWHMLLTFFFWPTYNLGWPEKKVSTSFLSAMETGYDITGFWVARMLTVCEQ